MDEQNRTGRDWAPLVARYEHSRKADEPGGIRDLDLPLPVYRALRNGGIVTIDQLASTTDEDILRVRGIGPVALRTIHAVLIETIPVATAQTIEALRRKHRQHDDESES